MLFSLLGFLLGFISGRLSRGISPKLAGAVARVNDVDIPRDDFEKVLRASAGTTVLNEMIEEKLIALEAQKQGVTVPSPAPGGDFLKQRSDHARDLLRALLIRDASEERKRLIYREFKDVLTEYDLWIIVLGNESDYLTMSADLKEGEDFQKALKTFSRAAPPIPEDGHLGFRTYAAIEEALGTESAEAVLALKVGKPSGLLHTRLGPCVLQVNHIHDQYPQLTDKVEDLIAGSRRVEFLAKLHEAGQITVP